MSLRSAREHHSVRMQTQLRRYNSLIVFPCSMKQIPFMVPQHTCTTPPTTRQEHFTSEPSSPSSKRPSVEIPGAYALGSIDPSLYRISDEDDNYDIPPDHLGRIWFAVEYERETEKLLVTLIKAKNLPSRTFGTTNACDPFVR
ncbi:hypothetical protein ACF0H5_000671 [Mactra antiquata]